MAFCTCWGTSTITPARRAAWKWPKRGCCTESVCQTPGSLTPERDHERRPCVPAEPHSHLDGTEDSGTDVTRVDRRVDVGSVGIAGDRGAGLRTQPARTPPDR